MDNKIKQNYRNVFSIAPLPPISKLKRISLAGLSLLVSFRLGLTVCHLLLSVPPSLSQALSVIGMYLSPLVNDFASDTESGSTVQLLYACLGNFTPGKRGEGEQGQANSLQF